MWKSSKTSFLFYHQLTSKEPVIDYGGGGAIKQLEGGGQVTFYSYKKGVEKVSAIAKRRHKKLWVIFNTGA